MNKRKKSKFIDVENVFRREFKIKGSVGEPGEKINYRSSAWRNKSSLVLREATLESEIVESVIRPVVPGIALRSYLEATPDMTLSKLKKN